MVSWGGIVLFFCWVRCVLFCRCGVVGVETWIWSLCSSSFVELFVSYRVVNVDVGLLESGIVCMGGVDRMVVRVSLHGLYEHLWADGGIL